MTSARARANHCLYLARILLAAWARALDDGEVPAGTLNQAYLPAVREHLIGAYGWFLLEVSGAEVPDAGAPPRSCDELPAVTPGRAVSGEIREFRQLEAGGWLAGMLAAPPLVIGAATSPDNLASSPSGVADLAEAQAWQTELLALFGRMSDSLDEF